MRATRGSTAHSGGATRKVVPLSRTMKEHVDQIRR
jgi:hypothetical protein